MNKRLTTIGVVLTGGYCVFLVWLVQDKVASLRSLPLNEVGDFLAGAFGPLAVLWLVLGYFQQGEELRQNTEALRLQAEELRRSVEQQRELVSTSRAQVAADQQRYRDAIAPRILFLGLGGGVRPDGRYHFDLDVTNTGAMASRVSLEFRTGLVSVSQDSVPQFPPNSHFSTHLVFEAGFPKPGDQVVVSFFDALGKPGKLRYDILLNEERTHCQVLLAENDG
jgi:hypothetical protein